MKICFLTYNIFSNGGVQRVITTLANKLEKKNKVDVICTNVNYKKDYEKYKLSKNINIIYKELNCDNTLTGKVLRKINDKIGFFNNSLGYKILFKNQFETKSMNNLLKEINSNNYDVIIGCEGDFCVLLGAIRDKLNVNKVIGWEHNSYDAYFNKSGKYYWNKDILFKKYIKNLDKHVVLTKNDKEKYSKHMGLESIVIYNPLSFTSNKKSNLKNKKILAVGRLTEQKGFDNLIKAFKIATTYKAKDWQLEIVGDGDEFYKLKNLIKRLDLEKKIKISGFTNQIQEHFLESSIYAMSSNWEGFGLVVTEALEFGLPVVSFKTTGPYEILNNYNCGEIVELGDLNTFAKKLEELMISFEKREEMSKCAVNRAKDFSIEKIISIWEKIFN
ncbi:glycosyltransferase family 4 protein [Clostridium perfringens]|uniref:glycosyltransferase family 4 protein n=1 Tax=Clostridium perfringens TaxID=1502 RepID=UPI001ABB01E2|nr:glycosyltransferase family 4 protein [Clostridium perfringens]ELC8348637.1 glycosyltransferase family 4 protein [Clostridium perfringens]MBO3369216.1 glycosyltransferase family 4 protein [Clostridium perfringens]